MSEAVSVFLVPGVWVALASRPVAFEHARDGQPWQGVGQPMPPGDTDSTSWCAGGLTARAQPPAPDSAAG